MNQAFMDIVDTSDEVLEYYNDKDVEILSVHYLDRKHCWIIFYKQKV
jgi:hypothetical protein